jgi:hypothetical protein
MKNDLLHAMPWHCMFLLSHVYTMISILKAKAALVDVVVAADVTAVIKKVTDAAVVPAAIPKAETVPAAFAVTNAAAVVVVGILL